MTPWQYFSAADLGLPGGERRSSLRRETGLWESGLRLVWLVLTRILLRAWNRLEIHGSENLPARPPFVLVANHTSHLDAVVLAAALPLRWRDQVSPLAAGDYFFGSTAMARFAAGILNALPVWRMRRLGQRHELADLRERLVGRTAVYIVFPEGGRSRDGRLQPFKPGFATLVAGNSIPVVPCHLAGNHAALAPGTFLLRPHKIVLHIGRPKSFAAYANDAAAWRDITAIVRAEAGLLGRNGPSSRRLPRPRGGLGFPVLVLRLRLVVVGRRRLRCRAA